ncbi:MAG TPA: radical SAM protein [Pyrinomonadaceae bacterium]|nr:radical SAM protein [Pyrinomonadaceae bacterium]
MSNRILLMLPPFFTPLTPPLGISILKTYLEKHGYAVTCFDFNTMAQQWNMHHRYFARLQSLESVSIQDGYSKLWHILNDHMLAHMNGTSIETLDDILPRIISLYGVRSEPTVVKELIALVEEYFDNLASTLFSLFDFSEFSHVGTSTYTTSLSSSLFLLRSVKERYPHVTTIIGGGVFADDLALGSENFDTLVNEYPFIDHIIIGEGESLLLKLLDGQLADKRVITIEDVQRVNLDMIDVPVPTFSDFNMQEYFYLTIEGARSCPFQCSFCSETIQWGEYRKKPPIMLGSQMIRLAKTHGNNTFFMGDSLMNPYIQELSKVLLERDHQVYYDGYLRADKPVTHRDRVKLWAKSGLMRVRMGIESASTRVLKSMDKMTTPHSIAETLKSLANAGVRTTTYWIVGFPGETEDDFNETLEFIRENYHYIFELEAHPHLYYPYGQVGSRLYDSRSLYPEEVTNFTRFKKWEIVDQQPTRDEKFERLCRLSELAAELGLINIYTEEARYRAERRWHALYPLAAEVVKGTRLHREKLQLHQTPLEVFAEEWTQSIDGRSGTSEAVHCYHTSVNKTLDEDVLRAATYELIGNNEMLQMSLIDGQYVPVAEEVERRQDRLVTTLRPDAGVDPSEYGKRALAELSGEMRPERGASLRVVLIQGEDASCELLLLVNRAVADSSSVVLLMQDLFRIYEQLNDGQSPSLLPVELPYSTFMRERQGALTEIKAPASFAGGTITARNYRTSTLLFDEDLARRIFTAHLLKQYDLSLRELMVMALLNSLAQGSGGEGEALYAVDNFRFIEQKLKQTACSLTFLRCLPPAGIERKNLAAGIDLIHRTLRTVPASLPADHRESAEDNGWHDAVLLNLEYLIDDPWLGGDEWLPRGFVLSEEEPGDPYLIEVMPVLSGKRIEVRLKYADTQQGEALARTITNFLPQEILSIVEYCHRFATAEKYWLNEMPKAVTEPNLEAGLLREENVSPESEWASIQCPVDEATLESLKSKCEAEPADIILAAYSTLLSRLNGREDLVFVAAFHHAVERTVSPLRLYPLWNSKFKEFVREVEKTRKMVSARGIDAFKFLDDAQKILRREIPLPTFDVGFQAIDASGKNAFSENEMLRDQDPHIQRELKLLLSVTTGEHGFYIEMFFSQRHLSRSVVEMLAGYLNCILEEAKESEDIKLEDFAIGDENLSYVPDATHDAADAFHF